MGEPLEICANGANQYVTFLLGEETYALDVDNAREILDFSTPARLPNSPEWLRGVINLRGSVVPVVDLKQKFGMHATEKTRRTCIIVVEILLRGQSHTLGVLADAAQEVFEMEASEIEPAPTFGTRLSTHFIRGMGKRNGKLFVILAAEKVFSEEEAAVVGMVDSAIVPEPAAAEQNRSAAPAEAAGAVRA